MEGGLLIRDEKSKDIQFDIFQLPGYFKFCLINSKENLRNMRRANQEIKETRFLWYQLQKQNKQRLKQKQECQEQRRMQTKARDEIKEIYQNSENSEKYSDQKVQTLLEGILKRFQRIKINQHIQKENEGYSWKLQSEKQDVQNRDKEDFKMIVENLDIKKSITNEQDLREKFDKIKQKFKDDAVRKKNLVDKQKNQQIDHIIQKSYDRIYRMNQTSVRSIKSDESEYMKNKSVTKLLQEKNLQSIDQIKNMLKSAKIQIKRKHIDNYSQNQLPHFLKKVFSNERK